LRKYLIFLLLAVSAIACHRLKEPGVELTTGLGTFSIKSRYLGLQNINTIVYLDYNGNEQEINLSSLDNSYFVDYFSDKIGSGVKTVIQGTHPDGFMLTLEIFDYKKEFFTVRIGVDNLSLPELIVKGFDLAITGTNDSAIVGDESPDGLLANGYQSWSPAVVSKIVDASGIEEEQFENVENNQDTLYVDMRNSWWFSVLHAPSQSIVSGTLTAERWKTRVLTYTQNGKYIWKIRCGKTYVTDFSAEDRIQLLPDESTSSELFFIGIFTDPVTGLLEYGKSLSLTNPSPEPPFIPAGWNSWNELFNNINETKIIDNARFIKENFPLHGFNNIQIDDGWERSWGDWEPNSNFPSGMSGIAEQLKGMGFIPGIWMAPFLVSDTAPVYSQHPEWLLRDENGSFLKYERYFILDTTHPEALNWLMSEIDKILNWGYRYLKLDFLFAGAYEGKRFNHETSMQAFRATMGKILAKAESTGAYVLACGTPIIPTAGLAHGARIGGDIAFSAIRYNYSFVKNEARNIALRFFLNSIFANDPDTVLLREISLEEARMNFTSGLLSGKIFALGDNLPTLPPEKLALIQQIKSFPIFNEIKKTQGKFLLKPVDLFRHLSEPLTSIPSTLIYPELYTVPSVWVVLHDPLSATLGLFNWEEQEIQVEVSLHELGLEPGHTYLLTELWSNTAMGSTSDYLKDTLPPRSAKLIYIQQEQE